MTHLDRRDLLSYGMAGIAGASLSSALAPLRAMARAAGGSATVTGKLLVIFLRGANDGVTACIPYGDATYPAMRQIGGSSAYVDEQTALPLFGSTYARLNPVMDWLAGPDAAGDVAWIHQAGNPQGLRSHFTEQQILETGEVLPEHMLNPEGWVPRLVLDPAFGVPGAVPSCSVSTLMQRAFRTPDLQNLQIHIRDLATLSSTQFSDGLIAHLAHEPAAPAAGLVDASGDQLLAAHGEITAAVPPFQHDPAQFPATAADAIAAGLPPYGPGFGLLKAIEEALWLLRHTSCRVAGVEFGGFDTHQNQIPQQSPRLEYLAFGMSRVHALTLSDPLPVASLTITEFGRTAAVNGNNGTDHGVGSLMIACGRNVNGGVYNCHDPAGSGLGVAPWTRLGDLPPIGSGDPFANACFVKTHFVAIYEEICQKLFGVTDASAILPSLGGSGAEFQQLGFLS